MQLDPGWRSLLDAAQQPHDIFIRYIAQCDNFVPNDIAVSLAVPVNMYLPM